MGEGLYAFTGEGDPNTGVIIGDDSVMIVEAQATPRLARKVIDSVRSVTDKPISHVVLTHYHAVRVLCASAYGAREIIMSDLAAAMVEERGQEDYIAAFEPRAIAPGRGDALVGEEMVAKAIASTEDFIRSTYKPVERVVARGGSLKEAWDAVRAACDPKFASFAIYEHCLPFNVARAYDEARGIDTPRIWTAERDRAMWAALQG